MKKSTLTITVLLGVIIALLLILKDREFKLKEAESYYMRYGDARTIEHKDGNILFKYSSDTLFDIRYKCYKDEVSGKFIEKKDTFIYILKTPKNK